MRGRGRRLALLAAFVVAGCGGGDSSPSATEAPTVASTVPPPEVTGPNAPAATVPSAPTTTPATSVPTTSVPSVPPSTSPADGSRDPCSTAAVSEALGGTTAGTGSELVRHECANGWAAILIEPAPGGDRSVVLLEWSDGGWRLERGCPSDVLGVADCLDGVDETAVDGLAVVGEPSARTVGEIDPADWFDRCGSQVLRRGDRGVCVARLQVLLYLVEQPSLVADGRFGPLTHDAVTSFQASHGLQVDGLVGPRTWKALVDAIGRIDSDMRGVNLLSAVDGGFVAVGHPDHVIEIWTSPDGISWLPVSIPPDAFGRDLVSGEAWVGCSLTDLASTGTEYLAVGGCWTDVTLLDGRVTQRPLRSAAWTSRDLRTWLPIDLPCVGLADATAVSAADGDVLLAGECDGDGAAWTRRAGTWQMHPAPFDRIRELVGGDGVWFARDESAVFRSVEGVRWEALPEPEGSFGLVDIAARHGTLYALGYLHRQNDQGCLWSRPVGDGESGEWTRIDGLSASRDFHSGGSIAAGEAGLAVSWVIGYWPSAHATQPPDVLQRGDVLVWLYRDSQPTFVITDLDQNELLAVDPVLGRGADGGTPDHVEVDLEDELVRFFDPSSGRELVTLTFRDLADSWAQIAGPPTFVWWSSDGLTWNRLHDFPGTGVAAVGDRTLVAAHHSSVVPDIVWDLLGEIPPTRTAVRVMP